MGTSVSFTHVLNPFPATPGSMHAIASRVTWQSLRVAHERAVAAEIKVNYCAVVLRGDEATVEAPVNKTVYLTRTVLDIAKLQPRRPLPLIADILNAGADGATTSHLIFSNMDIALQPHFYRRLGELVTEVGSDTPFTVPRVNIDPQLANGPLEAMYAATGPLGVGYDCFVIPIELLPHLDLGTLCIGAPHFDNMLVIELDVVSKRGIKTLTDERLTFHLGSDIAWAAMIDYVEHNLAQSLAAIRRMRQRFPIPDGGLFDRVDRRHFRRNAALSSALLRKVRRLPGVSQLILRVKRAIGRQF